MNRKENVLQFCKDRGFVQYELYGEGSDWWLTRGNIRAIIKDTLVNVYHVTKVLYLLDGEDLDKTFNFMYGDLDETLKEIDDFLLQLTIGEM